MGLSKRYPKRYSVHHLRIHKEIITFEVVYIQSKGCVNPITVAIEGVKLGEGFLKKYLGRF